MPSALLIEADPQVISSFKSVLSTLGFEVAVTADPVQAVNFARDSIPDLILLRVELPTATGFSVCNKLRRNADTGTIPLVLYSSDTEDATFEQHSKLKARASTYVRLPISDDALLQAVKGLVRT